MTYAYALSFCQQDPFALVKGKFLAGFLFAPLDHIWTWRNIIVCKNLHRITH